MVTKTALETFKAIPYIKIEHLADGRTVNVMPLWDGKNWHMWVPSSSGFTEGMMIDAVEGDYVGIGAARENDLYIPFVELMWQRASWPDVCPFITSIADDFRNMSASLAKLRLFFDCSSMLASSSAERFASTEVEYLVILARTVFDSLQEIIRTIWKAVRLKDAALEEKHRRASQLPKSFGDVLLRDNQPQDATAIENRYVLPAPLAQMYTAIAPFFLELRTARNKVAHGGTGVGFVFKTERGFCVNPKHAPFSSFDGWRIEHNYNEQLVSLLPWVGHIVIRTVDACNSLMNTFASVIQLPPEIAPGYHIYVRGPHTDAIVEALNVYRGQASPWWEQRVSGSTNS